LAWVYTEPAWIDGWRNRRRIAEAADTMIPQFRPTINVT
jgi:allantoicase